MKTNENVIKIVIIISVIGLWHAIVKFFVIPVYIFPNPFIVFNAWANNIKIILTSSGVTIFEALAGFFIANLLSIFLAIFISFHRRYKDVAMPVAIIIKTMPIIAITPLLVIWFGSGIFSKVITAALICFFPSLVNVLRGVKSLDKKFFALFKTYSANRNQLIKKLIFPSIFPYLFSAFKTSISLAVVGALVGEFIGSNRGLGFLIISNYYNMNTPLVFAAIITSSMIGISFYYIINYFERRFIVARVEIWS